jgi:DNA-binding XRE family transcriptional regulator
LVTADLELDEKIRQMDEENIKRTLRGRKPAFGGFASSRKPWRKPMAFGRYIRRAREQRALTVTEVAKRLDISIAYLSRIEREREKPPPDRLMTALARALDLPTDDVFAAARRLPPDLRARTEDVIAVYRQQAVGRSR